MSAGLSTNGEAARPSDGAAAADLRQHLVSSRLAGQVATTVTSSLGNCRNLVAGDPLYTFGLSDWRDATYDEAVAAVGALGGEPAGRPGPDAPGACCHIPPASG